MSVDPSELLSLPPAEKLRIVELLWDHLGEASSPIPLPEWIDREAKRRPEELTADPSIGLDHDTVWQRIEDRNG